MVQFHKRNKAQAINLVKQCYMHRDWFLLRIRTIAITYIPVYVIHAYISCMYHCNDLRNPCLYICKKEKLIMAQTRMAS